jgi:hypothetical protein
VTISNRSSVAHLCTHMSTLLCCTRYTRYTRQQAVSSSTTAAASPHNSSSSSTHSHQKPHHQYHHSKQHSHHKLSTPVLLARPGSSSSIDKLPGLHTAATTGAAHDSSSSSGRVITPLHGAARRPSLNRGQRSSSLAPNGSTATTSSSNFPWADADSQVKQALLELDHLRHSSAHGAVRDAPAEYFAHLQAAHRAINLALKVRYT